MTKLAGQNFPTYRPHSEMGILGFFRFYSAVAKRDQKKRKKNLINEKSNFSAQLSR